MGLGGGFLEPKLVGECIWLITGLANDLMYLVVRSHRAMLVDTGMGIGKLADVVKGLIGLPVVVVNTRGS
jgi:hydroxyacylglutathione hydrolase